ncbi:MAG: enoyl-CoA hydratase/isomerase family protein [Rhodospirillales bacterium]|nr:MAG: enoyl-CoA hydratase/isomerase family protein [Rhodospirillales bacterium]
MTPPDASTATPATTVEEVLYAVDGHVATVTLNAPARMNTISRPMLEALSAALVRAGADREVWCVVLTGAGDRAFCAGLDLQAQKAGTDSIGMGKDFMRTTIDLRETPPTVLHQLEKPVVCALNGSAAGYGLDIALGADIRIMSDKAKLAASYAKRGVLPESGGTWYLPRLLGWSKAAELIFTGRTLSAEESLALGLVSRVVPAGEVAAVARAMADEICANAPLAVQAAKRMMRMAWNEPFNEHVHHVFLQLLPLFGTKDTKEGIAAFVERRAPVFTGK